MTKMNGPPFPLNTIGIVVDEKTNEKKKMTFKEFLDIRKNYKNLKSVTYSHGMDDGPETNKTLYYDETYTMRINRNHVYSYHIVCSQTGSAHDKFKYMTPTRKNSYFFNYH